MSLNITFNADLLDSNEAEVANIRYRGYHKESNTWSDWYDSGDETQYNINAGDAEWLGQDGTVNTGDTFVLIFETQEDEATDRQFAVMEIAHDGSQTYTNKVKLMGCQAPNVNTLWRLSSDTDLSATFVNSDNDDTVTYIARINDTVSALTDFNDYYTWEYEDITFTHTDYVYAQDVFSDRVGIDTIQFDWDESDTLVDDTSHVFDSISQTDGDKSQEVSVTVKNLHGQSVTDTLMLQVRYNTPVPLLTWDPEEPTVEDTFTITADISDVDSTISAISYTYEGEEVDNNTETDYSWTQDLGDEYEPTHNIGADVTWNDGFTDFTIPYSAVVHMTNLAPSFTLTTEVIGDDEDNDIKFIPTDLVDPDGDDASLELKWVIEYKTPFDNTYKTVYSPGYPDTANLDAKEWIFNVGGDYKVTAIAKDEHGLETAVSADVSFASGSDCDGSGQVRLNNDVWQLISIPVKGQAVSEYFLNKIEAILQTYDGDLTAADAVEVVNAYPGQLNKFLSFIPGVTSTASEHNFPLVMSDGSGNIDEILGFWVRMKDYHSLTNDEDIIIKWSQAD